MSVWRLEQRIGRQLLAWGVGNVAVGGLLLLTATPFVRGLGLQAVVWGTINAGIAVFGQSQLPGKLRRMLRHEGRLTATRKERQTLRKILLINAGLDVIYIVAGLLIVTFMQGPFAAGNGWGIVLQGGFLLLFDAVHGGYSVAVADD